MATNQFGDVLVDPLTQEMNPFGDTLVDPLQEVTTVSSPVVEQDPFAGVDLRTGSPITQFSNRAVGEFAAGANESIIGFVDLLAKSGNLAAGGYNGLMTLMQTGDLNTAVSKINQTQPIPMLSDSIDMTLASLGKEFADISMLQNLSPTRSTMDPSLIQQGARTLGQFVPAVLGMSQVAGRNVTTSAGQAAELVGFGSAAPVKTVADIVSTSDDLAELAGDPAIRNADDFVPSNLPATIGDDIPVPPSGNKQLARSLAVKRGAGDAAAAGYKLDDAGRAIPDPVQKTAIKYGVDEGAVAMIKAANRATKDKMNQMLEIIRGGKQNLEYRALNRPNKIVGQSLDDRLRIVRAANKQSGKAVDKAAQSLKGKPIDVSPAIDDFMEGLNKYGIEFDPQTGVLNFDDSAIEGLDQAQGIIRRMVKRLYRPQTGPTMELPDAYKVHEAKRFIDNQVTYGKTQGGLSGEMANLLKRLRRNLDGILDENFDDYNAANTGYSETIRVLDDVQSLAGGRVDLLGENADRALGIMSRKILSNYASGTSMLDMFSSLDDTARRYSSAVNMPPIDDEIVKLVAYEAELRRLFPSAVPANSLQGIVGAEGARTAADLATGNKAGLIARGARYAADKLGPTEDDQIKALADLLID